MPSTRSFDALRHSALSLIAAHGVDALTLSQVAAHARVSRATAYREFGDKDGLIGAVAAHEIGLMLAAVQSDPDVTAATAEPSALVAAIVVSALRYLRNHAAFTYVRDHEPHWLLHAVLSVGDSRMDLVQTVASAVTPTAAVDAHRLRVSMAQAAEVMVRAVLSHSLIENSTLTDEEVGQTVAHAIIAG
ncbi:TetR/AcrR family transcriptional regulator [Mycobacterium sp. SMC-4]|uniref:TetR/AcrR family transcriptional regulator n=1 Tax=Mycobacterium sp. SMC-4 TaxID=2857059 RepID=UPI003D07ED80